MQTMTPDDESKGYGKTSIKLTRRVTGEVALKVRLVLNKIKKNDIHLSSTAWQEFITYVWEDPIWIAALNKAISKASFEGLQSLNCNGAFLYLIEETIFWSHNEYSIISR